MSGFLMLDKPVGLSSSQALQRARYIFEAAKAGHTGSLDPLATGMLPVCFGDATKVSRYLLEADKSYSVVARLGIETDTGDCEGETISTCDAQVDESAFATALGGFLGDHEQIPPMYSALKHEGQRLYALARQGKVVERKARPFTISAIDLEEYAFPRARFRVRCSKGTYVRTLVCDIAAALGTVGHVERLRRLAVQPFENVPMWTLEALVEVAQGGHEALDALLHPVDAVLGGWPEIVLDAASARRVCQGQRLVLGGDPADGWHRLYSPSRDFIGIGEVVAGKQLVPRRIFDA